MSWVWWLTPLIPVLEEAWAGEDLIEFKEGQSGLQNELQGSQGYIENSLKKLKPNQTKTLQQEQLYVYKIIQYFLVLTLRFHHILNYFLRNFPL